MKLWHVSDTDSIQRFEPRPPPRANPSITEPVVWAVSDERLPNYLLPRDCPRVAFAAAAKSSAEDTVHFFGANPARYVIAIESAWLERVTNAVLYAYSMPVETFTCADETAGYFISRDAIIPDAMEAIHCPIERINSLGIELRILPELHNIARAVSQSSLAFSCIRLKMR